MKKFISTRRKGFHMTFENGLTVSVQWGAGNYCENHNSMDFTFSKDAEADEAEVAVYHGRRFLYPQHFLREPMEEEHDFVIGWMTSDEVVDLLMKVKSYPAEKINELRIAY